MGIELQLDEQSSNYNDCLDKNIQAIGIIISSIEQHLQKPLHIARI
jgi:hypothetical protein